MLSRAMLAAALLCAGCTTATADDPQQRLCSRYVDLFLDPTPHAPPPGTSQASHGSFEIAEAGQLELSNHDKALAKQVLDICEQEGVLAQKRAQHELKPWYKRIFG